MCRAIVANFVVEEGVASKAKIENYVRFEHQNRRL